MVELLGQHQTFRRSYHMMTNQYVPTLICNFHQILPSLAFKTHSQLCLVLCILSKLTIDKLASEYRPSP